MRVRLRRLTEMRSLSMTAHDITLRPAEQADETFLLNLRTVTMTEHLKRVGQDISDADHYDRMRFRYGDAQIVCHRGVPIGLVKAYREDLRWVIIQLQILPPHQGQGIGEHVLSIFLARAQQDQLPVQLRVLRGNPARRLYERLGFCPASENDDEITLVWNPRA